jgi:hypothetical protein
MDLRQPIYHSNTDYSPTYLRVEDKPQVAADTNMFKVLDNNVFHDFTFTFTVVNKARAEKPDLSGLSFRNTLYCKP